MSSCYTAAGYAFAARRLQTASVEQVATDELGVAFPPPPPGVPPAGREFPPPAPAEHEEILPVDADWNPASLEGDKDKERIDGATEHVLLSLYDLQELRRRRQPNAQTLHDEARHWTNFFAEGRYHSPMAELAAGVQADLAAQWDNWKVYIAKHKNADKIIGPGVVSFTAEFVEGTLDPQPGR